MKRVFLAVFVTLAIVFTVWYGYTPVVLEVKTPPKKAAPIVTAATVLEPAKPIPPFALVDTNGRSFNEQSLFGHWSLLFFGYAACPETCPKTLAIINDVWQHMPEAHAHNPIRFLFISLDPKTDTVPKLKEFLGRFNPKFIGLTGDKPSIDNLSKSCSIYAWEDPNSKVIKKIDHSATLILVDPRGRIRALFTPPYLKENLINDLQAIIKN